MTTPAGWYDDPSTPGGQRWWDGEQWTEHVVAPTEANDAVPVVVEPDAAPATEPVPAVEPVLDPTMPFEALAAPGPPPGMVIADDTEAAGPPAPARGGRILLAVAGVIVLVAAAAAALLLLGGDDEGTVTPDTVPIEEAPPATLAPSTTAAPTTAESTTTTEPTTTSTAQIERTPEQEAARADLIDELMSEPDPLTEAAAICIADGVEAAGIPFELTEADATEEQIEILTSVAFDCILAN